MDKTSAQMTKRLNDLRNALDMAAIVVVTDISGRIIFVNNKLCEISGYTRGELIGQGYDVLNSGFHNKRFFYYLWRTVKKGEMWRGQIKNINKNRQDYWLDTTVVPFLDEKSEPFQYIAICQDITHLKQTEKQLAGWKARYEEANYVTHQVVYERNLENNEIIWGKMFENLLGFNPYRKKINGKEWLDLIHPEDKEKYTETLSVLTLTQDLFQQEYRLKHNKGSYIHVKDISKIYPDENGKPNRLVGAVIDITKEKEFDKLIKELPQRIIKAQEKEKKRIALDIHDDLGQSLIGLKMLASYYRQDSGIVDPTVKKFLDEMLIHINSCIEKARSISYDLVPPQLRLLGLNEAIKEMVSRFHKDFGITIKFESRDLKKMPLKGDEINVYRIVQEAFGNIIKHSRATEVEFNISYSDTKLNIYIKDNGGGFDRAQIRKKKSLDRGLGLSVMRERAKLLGGTCKIDSSMGHGTAVKVSIPLKKTGE